VKTEAAKVSLRKQLITCAVLCGLAVAVILLFHSKPYVSTLLSGLPLLYQILLGITVGVSYWVLSLLGSRFAAHRKTTQSIADNYNRLDLSGWNPLWIAIAAALGEELLFRGALQPLLGIWITSALFVLAHIRAYKLNKLAKRVLFQSASIFGISVVLGFVAAYAGLVAAMIIHAAMDTFGLYAVRRMARAPATAAI
jgi:hypothetical protein